jgi:hypothetical protein
MTERKVWDDASGIRSHYEFDIAPGVKIRSRAPLDKPVQWLTTAPNPRSSTKGFDAGQRGWRMHAVRADDQETLDSVSGRPALCGLVPSHGWSVDLFIDQKCKRCVKALTKQENNLARGGKRGKANRGSTEQ